MESSDSRHLLNVASASGTCDAMQEEVLTAALWGFLTKNVYPESTHEEVKQYVNW